MFQKAIFLVLDQAGPIVRLFLVLCTGSWTSCCNKSISPLDHSLFYDMFCDQYYDIYVLGHINHIFNFIISSSSHENTVLYSKEIKEYKYSSWIHFRAMPELKSFPKMGIDSILSFPFVHSPHLLMEEAAILISILFHFIFFANYWGWVSVLSEKKYIGLQSHF